MVDEELGRRYRELVAIALRREFTDDEAAEFLDVCWTLPPDYAPDVILEARQMNADAAEAAPLPEPIEDTPATVSEGGPC